MFTEHDALNAALVDWVRRHPHPNDPTISLLGRSYSPRDILDEVRQETPFGARFVSFVRKSAEARRVSPEKLIQEMAEENQRFSLQSRKG